LGVSTVFIHTSSRDVGEKKKFAKYVSAIFFLAVFISQKKTKEGGGKYCGFFVCVVVFFLST